MAVDEVSPPVTSGALARAAVAEGVGTALLVAIVVGSGIFAQRLSPGDKGLQLLENSTATAFGLMALILAFGKVSGAHFNPVVTLADRFLGGIDTRRALAYIGAQVAGGCAGTIVANLMFDLPAVEWSTHTRTGSGLWLGEIVATFGLLTVILGVVRSGRAAAAPFAVGAYIGAAYWFTSSTSFANPAVTVARALTDSFAGIRPRSVPAFVVAQCAGAAVAVALARFLHPDLPADAERIVVPHDEG
ncbi:MAG TPA: MIP/aquaporin family protein [Acidimicrobiia bacterium]|nr:MIP/aquaporin family protein [Acidimicrobiia bacterium]